jgi:hypothetical protein
MGNMCVQAVSGKLEVRACNGSSSQKWNFFHPTSSLRFDQIQLSGSTSCVSASTTSGALGQELVLATCSSTDTKQRFSFPGNGRVVLKNNTSFCGNVAGGLPASGSKIVLWDGCGSTPPYNSQFLLSGRITSLSNCLSIQGGAVAGNPIRIDSCSSSNKTQTWEYYF